MEQSSELSAVLLAGGLGSRIRELFPDIPKPMIPIAGLPVSEWIVRLWASQGVRRFVISTGHLGHLVEQHFSALRLPNLHIECVQEPMPMGTAGALSYVAGHKNLSDPFLVANADSLSSVNIQGALGHMTKASADAVIFTAYKEETAQFGRIVTNSRSQILSFEEKVSGPGLVNAGVYLLMLSTLKQFPKQVPLSIEREVFPKLLGEHVALVSYPIDKDFLDIGTPAGYAAADAFVRSHLSARLASQNRGQ
jgi:D-glycero-alpha-D-manno-heptose 1-phosphate guanylyltransferase